MKIFYLLFLIHLPLFSMNEDDKHRSLIAAIRLNDLSTVQELIKKKVSIYLNKNQAIIEACKLGRTDIAQLLIDHSADIQDQNNCALLNACTFGHEQCVQLLIKHAALIDCKDGRPIEVVIQKAYLPIVTMLIRAGCKLQAKHLDAAKKRNALEKIDNKGRASNSLQILKIIEYCISPQAQKFMNIFSKEIQPDYTLALDSEKPFAQAAIMLNHAVSFDRWLTCEEFRTFPKLYGLFVYACVYHNLYAATKIIDALVIYDLKHTKNMRLDMLLYGLRYINTMPSNMSFFLVSKLAQELITD